MTAILKVEGLEVVYGAVQAVRGVDLKVEEGQIVALLGANGAGKSSIIRSVLGLVKPQAGKIEFPEGRDTVKLPAHKKNRLGIAWVPEGRQIFSDLTVHGNLLMGAFGTSKTGRPVDERVEDVMTVFPILRERREQLGGSLSGGEQQMLAIGRALMSDPKLLLMDEPSLGLAPLIVKRLFELIKEIRDRGISILMGEQNARQSLKVADHVYLMESGEFRADGSAAEMESREDVQAAYLGG